METGINRNQILSELSRSAHGKLAEYGPIINPACRVDAEFVAHLIAWDFINGQVKDAKVALPVLTLASRDFPDELVENSLAHLALQPPRELLKALRFSVETGTFARRQRLMEKMVRRYLGVKESEPGRWSRLAARHRRSLKTLYALSRCACPEWVSVALFGGRKIDGKQVAAPYVAGSIFSDISNLHCMAPAQAAAVIQKWHLSPLVVSGAMTGAKAAQESSAVVQATMDQMSDTEVVTRAASLEKKGVGRDAALKETFRKKVSKATKSAKATLKTSVAADEVEDESLKTMLKELQERQIQAQKDSGRGIEGNWLVISDKSGSQALSIELGKHVAAAITKFVSGRVWLAFCDTGVMGKEVTGATLDRIKEGTRLITANGGTSYGVGLAWALQYGFELDGVVIVGDGAENSAPVFADQHREYKRRFGKDLPVYLLKTASTESVASCYQFQTRMNMAGIPYTEHDFSHGQVDYYSVPSLVQTLNANTFGVVDKVMAAKLLTLDEVFSLTGKVAA